MLEWFTWALGTWSLAGLFWFLFISATFVPDYAADRKALIPFVY